METFIEHKPLQCFVINTHAFHNAHLIRAVLPRDLTAPVPYAVDRRSHHDQIAQELRVTQKAKRKAATGKAAERKAARQNLTASGTDTPPEPIAGGRKKRKRGDHEVTVDLDAEEDRDEMEVDE